MAGRTTRADATVRRGRMAKAAPFAAAIALLATVDKEPSRHLDALLMGARRV